MHGFGHEYLDWRGSANCVQHIHWVTRSTLSLSAHELQCFREKWSHLFQGQQTMQAFMWQDDLIVVAKFVNACMQKILSGSSI